MTLLPVAEALDRILDGAMPTEVEPVSLAEAGRRVLAADLAATLTQPPFDASAMDGYAVRAVDVARLPASLRLLGEAAAGRAFAGSVEAGACVRILTGAPLPRGADAIVIQENTTGRGDRITVTHGTPDPAHIRPAGGDFRTGAVLLASGRLLDARALTLAAAMGHACLPVRRKPRVAILATGDELVEPGTVPGPARIVSSNPYGLAALVAATGGAPQLLGIAADTQAAIAAKLADAEGADIIVTTGGASLGDHDLVAPALRARGMELGFWRIAMRPGKPLLFGRLGPARVLGLPGNPVSALITGRVFLVPLIRRLLGLPAESARAETAILAADLGANDERTHYMRARLDAGEGGRPRVTPMPNQDSSLMAPLAAADCLIVRAPGAPALSAGAAVDILRLDF